MMLKIFLYIPLLFLISSCNSTESGLRKNIRKFRECSIVVPNDMLALKGRKEINADEYINKIQPKLIIYYDSLSCNSCQVSHLFKLTALYELADSTEAFDVMTIFSPKAEEYDELMKELMIRNFYYLCSLMSMAVSENLIRIYLKTPDFTVFLSMKTHILYSSAILLKIMTYGIYLTKN